MRFLIRFTVEEAAVGPVLAALNSHDGVVFSQMDISVVLPPKSPPGNRGKPPRPAPKAPMQRPPRPMPKVSKALTGREIVLQLLAAEGPQTYAQIKAALTSRGFGGGGVGSLLKKMAELYKEVEKLPDGDWRLMPSKED